MALRILTIVTAPKVRDIFNVKRIDVSNAFAESYGSREVVLKTEDILHFFLSGKEIQYIFPRVLRLSSKNYPQELSNYLTLRSQLLEDERKKIDPALAQTPSVRAEEKAIDFRLSHLAFIEQ